MIKLCLPLACK